PPKAVGKRFAVPDFVKTIGGSAFEGSPDLEEVILPPSVSAIGQRAFYGCRYLRSINLENVKRIDSYAFESCSRLTSVELFCEELGEYVFRSCHRMQTAVANSLKKCGCFPFDDNLHELILSDDVDPEAFKNALGGYRGSPDIITVRSRKTCEMLYKVSGVADNIFDLNNISNNFHGSDFDFESYDRYFEGRFGGNDLIFDITKIYTAFLRLKYPRRLSESAREFYLNVLSEEAEYALALAIRAKKFDALPELFEFGMINAANIISLVDYTVKINAPEFTTLLLELKEKYLPEMTDTLNLE
ncbi:MAG: leucine-rich repeat domain-containing protein, partial [Oscillospiraceae bacterium]|nr:leucine-rich repeat domain-containing protein [Oscillospiraceae bacterium]